MEAWLERMLRDAEESKGARWTLVRPEEFQKIQDRPEGDWEEVEGWYGGGRKETPVSHSTLRLRARLPLDQKRNRESILWLLVGERPQKRWDFEKGMPELVWDRLSLGWIEGRHLAEEVAALVERWAGERGAVWIARGEEKTEEWVQGSRGARERLGLAELEAGAGSGK